MDFLQKRMCEPPPFLSSREPLSDLAAPPISLYLQGGEVLCGQSGLLGLEVCVAVTRARHQREAGLSVLPLQSADQ